MGQAAQDLGALRAVFDDRLTTLEAVLEDPNRGESLERLILDLVRAAVDEAQAAAADASRVAEARAQREIVQAVASVESSITEERALASGLRQALEQAERRLAELEAASEAELHQASESFESDMAVAQAAHDAVADELARERAARASDEQVLTDLQWQVEKERGSAASLRKTVEDVRREREADAANALRIREQLEEAQRDLAAVRIAELAVYEKLAASQAQRNEAAAERLTAIAARQAAEAARTDVEGRLQAALRERDALTGELASARDDLAALAAALSEARSERTFVDTVTTAPESGLPELDDAEWTPIRLADRYVFRQPMGVQLDNASALLYDLSVYGCQLLASAVVKPNQQVTVTVGSAPGSVTCLGTIMWARLESPRDGGGLRYRVGVQFNEPDQPAIDAFIARHLPVK